MLNKKEIKVHFIGIGGIGMSGIAEVLLQFGYNVSGSDLNKSGTTEKLEKLGARVFKGHAKENIEGATVIVVSSAIDKENPEILEARKKKIPIMKRAEMLAELMRLKKGIAVAGTHGKTTTTSILATILQEGQFDPTYIIGGIVHNLKGHAKVGEGDWLVAEADESDGSFLLLNPVMSVITNIDSDHMDHYETDENLEKSFIKFANRVPFYGCCSININDERLKLIIPNLIKPYATFGIRRHDNDQINYEARNIVKMGFGSEFDLYNNGEFAVKIKLPVPGDHNIQNALGAISMAHLMGVSFEKIATSISAFSGVGRRMQLLYNKDGLKIIDDYAHHPTEIAATVKAVSEASGGEDVFVIFEPHRYTRTRDSWNEFIHCFNGSKRVFLSKIYAASEHKIEGISAKNLANDINRIHPEFVEYIEDISNIDNVIKKLSGSNATVLTLGAGSIGKIIREWVASNE